jgi:molybdenum cofactor guanylyltransferase
MGGNHKALLTYHDDLPQYLYLEKLLKPFTHQVFFSINQDQIDLFPQTSSYIVDQHKDCGPIAGLLAAFDKVETSILVCGCDYPMLDKNEILQLVALGKNSYDAICYHHEDNGIDEPLVAIYHYRCKPKLKEYFSTGHTSLRKFLSTIHTKRISLSSNHHLLSIDCDEDYKKMKFV